MHFTKMQGCGNDYVYVNCFEEKIAGDVPALARAVSDRHFGVGADGLILIAPSEKADARMIMYNADGSMSEMCGNGVRCVAKYVYDHGLCRKPVLRIETGNGIKEITVTLKGGRVESAQVNMGVPFLRSADIPATSDVASLVNAPIEIDGTRYFFTAVGMGNPHCIIYVDDVRAFPVEKVGPKIENHPFFPRRTNVEFVEVLSKGEVRQRTWERGSGETLACGTGASAVCVAGVLTGRTGHRLVNHLTGGDLLLEWKNDTAPVFMTGPCVEVFTGEWLCQD
ncbi:MAG: diaminopimelate epimerase [Fibrobacterota bacterium]